MINRSLMGRTPNDTGSYEDSADALGGGGLISQGLPPSSAVRSSADFGQDEANSLAFLGASPLSDESGGAVLPSEGGPTGTALAATAMMVQGAQLLSTVMPGLVPAEITMWLQQAMQLVPQIIQQQQSGLSAAGALGPMMGQSAMLGGMSPSQPSASPAPAGPPPRY